VPGNLSDLASVVTMATSIVRKRRPRSLRTPSSEHPVTSQKESNQQHSFGPELKELAVRASTWR